MRAQYFFMEGPVARGSREEMALLAPASRCKVGLGPTRSVCVTVRGGTVIPGLYPPGLYEYPTPVYIRTFGLLNFIPHFLKKNWKFCEFFLILLILIF